jgi:hypothetical protein
VENLPFTFKGNRIFDRINILPHFIDLLLGSGNAKSTLEFEQCHPEAMPNANFAIIGSGKRHLFAGVSGVDMELGSYR